MMPRALADWSRPLPFGPIVWRGLKLTTLADVSDLLEWQTPALRRSESSRHLAAQLEKAARGGNLTDLAISMLLVLFQKR